MLSHQSWLPSFGWRTVWQNMRRHNPYDCCRLIVYICNGWQPSWSIYNASTHVNIPQTYQALDLDFSLNHQIPSLSCDWWMMWLDIRRHSHCATFDYCSLVGCVYQRWQHSCNIYNATMYVITHQMYQAVHPDVRIPSHQMSSQSSAWCILLWDVTRYNHCKM